MTLHYYMILDNGDIVGEAWFRTPMEVGDVDVLIGFKGQDETLILCVSDKEVQVVS